MNDKQPVVEPKTPVSDAETSENDSLMTPAIQDVLSRYGAPQLRGLYVLATMAACFALGYVAATPHLGTTMKMLLGLACVVLLFLCMRGLQHAKRQHAEAGILDPDPYPPEAGQVAAVIRDREHEAAVDQATVPLGNAETKMERCTNPANHKLANLRQNTRCAWCGKTAGHIVKSYLRGVKSQ